MKNIKIPHVFRIKMIQTNSDWNWPREEEFLYSFKPDEGWWQMPSDDKGSLPFGSDEL